MAAALHRLLPRLRSVSPRILATVHDNVSIDTARYLDTIVDLTRDAAASLACSSFLAGQGSEADDLGQDIVVWLGPGDYINAPNVLAAFGLDSDAKDLPLTSEGLPPTLRVTSKVDVVDQWVDQMKQLDDKYCFRASLPDSVVLFVLVGRLQDVGWAALVGAGVWSDDQIARSV